MNIFLAGATGAIGRRLVPALVRRGHKVVGMTHRPEAVDGLRRLGAEPVVADALDRGAVMRSVVAAEPDVVVHQLTAIGDGGSYRNFDREFAATNRLRTDGTDHLLAAARAAEARRFVAQSHASWIYDPARPGLAGEDDPLDPSPPRRQRQSLAAIRYLEDAVLGAATLQGLALRYGFFYGPGTAVAPDGDVAEQLRRRRLPIPGQGGGIWSFIHVDDAAAATIAAIEGGAPGVYNVVDDDPGPAAEWLPELARVVGAPPPARIPAWVARLAAGEVGVHMMTRIRGVSNIKAKWELAWTPRHRSWRSGFRSALSDDPARRTPWAAGAVPTGHGPRSGPQGGPGTRSGERAGRAGGV